MRWCSHPSPCCVVVLVLLLTCPPGQLSEQSFNLSDIVLDRRRLLSEVARLCKIAAPLPECADASRVSAMDCARLSALGWRPGGWARLTASLPAMLGAEAAR